jgi:hypothetical protein
MSIRKFNVEHGLSIDNGNITIVDSNANVFANTLISNHIISTSGTNSNITISPDGTGVIDVSNKTISNLADPVYASDAATKGYVDATAQGLSIKNSVQYATTTNILLDGSVTTIDGKTVTTGDRVLVKDQTNKAQNGIYIASTIGAWTRSVDMNLASEIYGAFTFVETGTKNQSTGWVTTNSPLDPFTLNTTDITFTQFSGTGSDISTSISTLHVTGGTTNYVLAAKDNTGNVQFANIANYFLVQSNISTVVAGSTLAFTVDYANATYPGGIYTLKQLGPVSLSVTDQWSISGSNVGTTKNAYANYVSATPNIANVTLTFSLANANFNIQSTDSLTIGGTTLTGTQLLAINNINTTSPVNGNSTATVTIPYTSLATSVEYNGLSTVTNTVSVNFTNSRGSTGAGVSTASGTTLTATAPIPFNVTALSGTWAASSIPYWNLNQTFSWSATTTSGAAVASGNVTYANTAQSISGSLTSSGQTSSVSPSLSSIYTYTISTSDYIGSGANGAGTRQMTANPLTGTVSPATRYYPLFWKRTSSSALPTFAVTDNPGTRTYATGDGATTTTTSSDYLWIAIPNYPGNGSSLASHNFKHVFGGFDILDTPTVTGTQSIASGGQSYNYSIYGFSGFTTASNIITTS